MRKTNFFILTILIAAVTFTSCSGLLTAYKKTFYDGEKLPGETLEVGDVLFNDSSATPYKKFIKSSRIFWPTAIILSIDGDDIFCVVLGNYKPEHNIPYFLNNYYGSSWFIVSLDSKEEQNFENRLPSIEELKLIYQKKDMINEVLSYLYGTYVDSEKKSAAQSLEDFYSGIYYSSEIEGTGNDRNGDERDLYKALNFKDGNETTALDGYIDDDYDPIPANILTVFNYQLPTANSKNSKSAKDDKDK